ncbi:MAG: hypothetical protein Q7K57_26675 [Burkholderiaceae bacterium]|nr:hypothetical protein [Burkholderiaceae bacterium]
MHAPHDNEPSKLQLLLLLLKSQSRATTDQHSVPVKMNLPVPVFTRIDALSQHAGQDRNTVITELINVALAELDKELIQEDREAIDALQREITQAIAPTQ